MSCGDLVLGAVPSCGPLPLVAGDDYVWTLTYRVNGVVTPFPAGELFYELDVEPTGLRWPFTVAGSVASIKVESDVVASVPDRTRYRLKWLPAGEVEGGQTVQFGKVEVLG